MVAIIVAFMFVSVVLMDLGVQKWKAWQAMVATDTANFPSFTPDTLWQVPEGIHLSTSHTWFRADPNGGLLVGADSLIAYAIGPVSRIALAPIGRQVVAGQPLFRLVCDGRSVTVPSTLSGQIVAVNDRVMQQPGLLTSDPYGSGWICQITPASMESTPQSMRFGEKAIIWLESEFTRLSQFLSAQVPAELPLGATSQDGGFPSSGCLAELDSRAWSAFETEFLNQR